MAKDFVHLHVHSHYSINKGIARIRDLVNKAIIYINYILRNLAIW